MVSVDNGNPGYRINGCWGTPVNSFARVSFRGIVLNQALLLGGEHVRAANRLPIAVAKTSLVKLMLAKMGQQVECLRCICLAPNGP